MVDNISKEKWLLDKAKPEEKKPTATAEPAKTELAAATEPAKAEIPVPATGLSKQKQHQSLLPLKQQNK